MAEYIEREALLAKVANMTIIPDDLYDYGIMAGVDAVKKEVIEAPTADVAPVVYGEWKPYRDYFSKRHIGWLCTNCSGVQMDLSNGDTSYCPNCGANMNGGEG